MQINDVDAYNFTALDLVSLENISNTVAKMDEVIDSISDYFSLTFGAMSKTSSRSTRLKDGGYYAYRHFGKPLKFGVDIGFTWWWGDNQTYLTVEIYIPIKDNNNDEIRTFFKTELKDWEENEFDDCVIIGEYRTLNEFLAEGKDQISAMTSFLKKGIDKLVKLKNKNEDIFQ